MNTPLLHGKRIIILFEQLGLGGAERQGLLLARHLKEEQGAHVQVWAFHGPGRASEICDEYGIPWRVIPTPWGKGYHRLFLKLAVFAKTLRQAKPDMLLPYTSLPNVACGLVWRWTGATICVWNQRDEGLKRLGRKAERRAVSQTPCFVANSQAGADFLTRELEVHPDKIHVIHNGICLAKPLMDRNSWRKRLEVDNDCFLACMVANLHSNKDHATLIRAWRLVVERHETMGKKAVLVLAGRMDDAAEPVLKLVYDLGIGTKVRLLGQVQDVAGLLHAVNIGVFSSRSEGSPNGVLECMAAGLPVAGSDIPGIREAVGPTGLPFLAPTDDSDTLADRILSLATDPNIRISLGAANRNSIEQQFSPRRMVDDTVGVLNRAFCFSKETHGSFRPKRS